MPICRWVCTVGFLKRSKCMQSSRVKMFNQPKTCNNSLLSTIYLRTWLLKKCAGKCAISCTLLVRSHWICFYFALYLNTHFSVLVFTWTMFPCWAIVQKSNKWGIWLGLSVSLYWSLSLYSEKFRNFTKDCGLQLDSPCIGKGESLLIRCVNRV